MLPPTGGEKRRRQSWKKARPATKGSGPGGSPRLQQRPGRRGATTARSLRPEGGGNDAQRLLWWHGEDAARLCPSRTEGSTHGRGSAQPCWVAGERSPKVRALRGEAREGARSKEGVKKKGEIMREKREKERGRHAEGEPSLPIGGAPAAGDAPAVTIGVTAGKG